MNEKSYSSIKTLLKAVWVFASVAVAVTAAILTAMPAELSSFKAGGIGYIIAFGFAVWKAIENARKNTRPDGLPAWDWPWSSVPVILLCALLVGCTALNGGVTTHFTESITDPETGLVTRTEYMARTHAGILGKVDPTVHNWSYKWGGDENEITTGQGAEGADNTGQALAFKTFENVIGGLAGMIVPRSMAAQEPAVEGKLLLPDLGTSSPLRSGSAPGGNLSLDNWNK